MLISMRLMEKRGKVAVKLSSGVEIKLVMAHTSVKDTNAVSVPSVFYLYVWSRPVEIWGLENESRDQSRRRFEEERIHYVYMLGKRVLCISYPSKGPIIIHDKYCQCLLI